jgi:hypothetical protein
VLNHGSGDHGSFWAFIAGNAFSKRFDVQFLDIRLEDLSQSSDGLRENFVCHSRDGEQFSILSTWAYLLLIQRLGGWEPRGGQDFGRRG